MSRTAASKRGTRRARRGHVRRDITLARASDVTITRADGTVEVQPAYTPRDIRRIVKERDVSPAMKARIMRRDRGTCRYCGGNAECIDHRIPIAKGGINGASNLVAACHDCNTRKGVNIWQPQPRKSLEGQRGGN